MDFTDHPLITPWRKWTQHKHISAAQIQTLVRIYVLAFFDETIRGKKSNLLESGRSSRFPEVQVERWIPLEKGIFAGAAQNIVDTPTNDPR